MSQPLFIGAYDVGLQKNLEPFMIPEKAFPTLFNAYCFRGRIEKKFGYTSLGQLQRNLTTASLGNISGTAPTATFNIFILLGVHVTEPNAQIVPGTVANPLVIVIGPQTLTDTLGVGTFAVTGVGNITAATINYSTGIVTLTLSANITTLASTFTGSYHPGLPIMGLALRQLTTINFFQTVAFDTKYAYIYSGSPPTWGELAIGETWSGADYQLFWTTNFGTDTSNNDLFWATNFKDPIRYYNGSWNDFAPRTLNTAGADTLQNALILIPYKDRFIALNTIEKVGGTSGITFPQRARWSQNASPNGSIVLNADAWQTDTIGNGGFVDAPTDEEIVSCGFVKDTLVVYFERSTWQLAYTSNEVLPFIWQRINSELGAEGPFSRVTFDNALIAWGTTGIHQSNGVRCERMDQIIPDEVFRVNFLNNGTLRIYGTRDFRYELAYFSFPDRNDADETVGANFKFPNKVLVYNYRNDTWSYFRENFTAYGYFQLSVPIVWAQLIPNSGYSPWSVWQQPWNEMDLQGEVPDVVAGTQQGFVVVLSDQTVSNAPTLYISAFNTSTGEATSPDHNLQTGEVIYITGDIAGIGINNQSFRVTVTGQNTFKIVGTFAGTYIGGAIITLLSSMDISTKMFNPFWQVGKRHRLRKVEFLFPRTSEGEVTADIYVDTAEYSVTDTAANPSVLGTNIVSTFPEPNIPQQKSQEFIWHHMYPEVVGDTFQIQLSLSTDQLLALDPEDEVPTIAWEDVALHGMVLYFDPAEEFL